LISLVNISWLSSAAKLLSKSIRSISAIGLQTVAARMYNGMKFLNAM